MTGEWGGLADEMMVGSHAVACGSRWEPIASSPELTADTAGGPVDCVFLGGALFRSWQLLSSFCSLQDLSSGYWVLVVHFTRREAIKQIEVLQHVATNLGRSK